MLLSTSIAIYLHQFSPEETVDMLAEAGFTALDFGFFNPRYYAKELDGHFFTELRKKAEDNGLVFNQAHAPVSVECRKTGERRRDFRGYCPVDEKRVVTRSEEHCGTPGTASCLCE